MNKSFLFLSLFFLVSTSLVLAQDIQPDENYIVWLWHELTGSELDNSNLKIISLDKQWVVTHSTDKDFDIEISNKNKKDTEICLVSKDKKLNDNKNVYSKTGAWLKQADKKDKSGKDAYCYTTTSEDYLRFGEHSTIVEYQDIKMLSYDVEFGQANITLYKNVNGEFINNVDELFVYYNEGTYKFGANDSANENLSEYKYLLTSTNPIIQNRLRPYIQDPQVKTTGGLNGYSYQTAHEFNFEDICSREFDGVSANCEFNQIDEYNLEVTFISDKDIDPLITITGTNVVTQSILNNVTAETGKQNFTHLSIDDTLTPYDGLVGYWSFDGDLADTNGTTAYDFSKYNNDGTYAGNANALTNCGRYGNGGCFDGDGDYVGIVVTASKNSTSFWYKNSTSSGWSCIAYNGSSYFVNGVVGTIIEYPLNISGDDVKIGVNGSTYFNGSIDEVMIFNSSLTAEQVTAIYNNQSARFKNSGIQKLNGVDIEQDGMTDKVTLSTTFQKNFQSNLSARIGQVNASFNTSGLVLWMPFETDDNTKALDISGNYNSGTVVNAIYNSTGGRNETGAFSFDESWADYVDIGDFSEIENINEFSISVWVKNVYDMHSVFDTIISKAGTGNDLFILSWDNTEDITFDVTNGTDTTAQSAYIARFTDGITTGTQWHHITAVKNSTNNMVYVDGVLGGTIGNAAGLTINVNQNLLIGVSWNGSIDDVMIFNRSLSTEEIQAIYSNQSLNHPNYNGVPAYSDYQELSENNNTFDINTNAKFILPEFKFDAGNSTTNFYTPLLLDSVVVESWSEGGEEEEPTISIQLLNPYLTDNNYNATQNEFFRVDLNVTCLTGTCGEVNVSLDPKPIKTYTSSTEATCQNGICNKVLYSGIRFVEEDNKWKKIEDARSLKNSGIKCIINSDGENIAECLDWNMTSVTLEVSKEHSGSSPIRVLKRNNSITQEDLDKGKKEFYEKERKDYNFNSKEDKKEIIVNADFGDEIHFGEQSTTITLSNPSNIVNNNSIGVHEWANPENASASDNVVTKAQCTDGPGCHVNSNYLKAFNFSADIPTGATINGIMPQVEFDSILCFYGCSSYARIVKPDDSLTINISATSLGNGLKNYSNLTYLWGDTWTSENINSDNFGIVIYADSSSGPGGSTSILIDSVQIQINYTEQESSTTKSGLIPIEADWTSSDAFYTNATSNPLTTSSLSSGQSETITFYVNATGDLGTYLFNAYANLTSNLSILDMTSDWNVTIVSEEELADTSFTVSLPIGYTELNFTANNRSITNLNPLGQNEETPALLITNTGNVAIDIYLKMNSTASGFTLKADTDNNPTGSQTIEDEVQLIKDGLETSSAQNIWLWLSWEDKSPSITQRQLNTSVQED